MKVLLVVLALAVTAYANYCEEKCATCAVVERSECLAGMEKDGECGCCDVCSRFEGQKCDFPKTPFKFGQCGDGLECKKTAGGPICQCTWSEILCGTNNVTYSNLCQLMAAAVRENLQETLEIKSLGPCDPGSTIVTRPEYVRNSTSNNVVLACEAVGLPVPAVRWIVKKANGKIEDLPGEDDHLVVASRGGPGKYQVTTWMQVENLQKRHEGDYTCIATNSHKEDRATARIKVIN